MSAKFPWRPRAFGRDENGSVTVEFVIWLPFLFAFLVFATDVTLAFMRQSHVWQVSRETARIVSRYGMDEAAAEAYATQHGTIGETVPTVDVTIGTTDVVVEIKVPTSSITPFGTMKLALGDNLVTRVTHAMEPL